MDFEQVMRNKMKAEDNKIFALVSHYLNHRPDFISKEEMDEIVGHGVSADYAFSVILAAAFGLDIVDNAADTSLFNTYFNKMIRKLDENEYVKNPYFMNIKMPAVKMGNCQLKVESYKPYEGFVWNDILTTPEGRQIPQIGFFETEFKFPAVLENGRIWMTITPNEIETMKEAVAAAFGKVLTFGLGLGYYAYMASEQSRVESIVVIESNPNVIELFIRYILPQFKHGHKITIIRSDAFEYAQEHMSKEKYDFVFTDLWHDVSDGMDMYLKMKSYEKQNPSTTFMYWIEQSILCYL